MCHIGVRNAAATGDEKHLRNLLGSGEKSKRWKRKELQYRWLVGVDINERISFSNHAFRWVYNEDIGSHSKNGYSQHDVTKIPGVLVGH